MKRKLMLGLLGLAFLFCLIPISGYAAPPRSEKIQIPRAEADTYVYDQGNLINAKTKQQLNSMLVDLEKKTSVEFAVITVPKLNGLTNQEYSLELANTLSIGKKDKNNGILLFVSAAEKKNNVYIQVGKGMEGLLNDAKCGRILDDFFVPYRDKGDYNTAIDKTTQAIINTVATDKKVTISGVDKTAQVTDSNSSEDGGLSAGACIILFIVIIIVVVIVFASSTFGDGGSSGGSFGGGFGGGFSGGGSFGGGFGGGGFGGGGAGR